MKKLMLFMMAIAVTLTISGGFGTIQISTCKDYKDGVCTVKKIETVNECEKPLIINGKTYCR
jgi:hypothetical protein